jgi:hypothetical protein
MLSASLIVDPGAVERISHPAVAFAAGSPPVARGSYALNLARAISTASGIVGFFTVRRALPPVVVNYALRITSVRVAALQCPVSHLCTKLFQAVPSARGCAQGRSSGSRRQSAPCRDRQRLQGSNGLALLAGARACSSQRPARRYWFGPFAAVFPSILFHMIGMATGVMSVTMATVKAKRQRLSMVISHHSRPPTGLMWASWSRRENTVLRRKNTVP